jgi:hypothetical protein
MVFTVVIKEDEVGKTCSMMGSIRNAYRISVRKWEEKRDYLDPNIIMVIEEDEMGKACGKMADIWNAYRILVRKSIGKEGLHRRFRHGL